jgi:hypothetical protein
MLGQKTSPAFSFQAAFQAWAMVDKIGHPVFGVRRIGAMGFQVHFDDVPALDYAPVGVGEVAQ